MWWAKLGGYSLQDFSLFPPVGVLCFYLTLVGVIITNQNLVPNLVPLCGRWTASPYARVTRSSLPTRADSGDNLNPSIGADDPPTNYFVLSFSFWKSSNTCRGDNPSSSSFTVPQLLEFQLCWRRERGHSRDTYKNRYFL